jgi:ABC-type nitrate/sulfonate/bicarbonate transport system permease component
VSAARGIDVKAVALGIATVLGAGLLLEILIRAGIVDQFIVPFPSAVVSALARIAVEENLLGRFLLTMGEALTAALLLAAVGIPIGMLLHYRRLIRRAVHTWIAAMAAAPIVLMYPLFLVIFGRSAATIVAIGFVAALPAVVLKTVEALGATPRVLVRVGQSLNLSPRQSFAKIVFPASLPTIFVGLRLGLIFALINIVGVEFLINFGGLGQLVNELAERYDLAGTYAAIFYVIVVSVLVLAATGTVERWLRHAR